MPATKRHTKKQTTKATHPTPKPIKSKKCTRCSKRQKVEQFYKDKYIKDGYSSWCKSCTRDYDRSYAARKRAEKAGQEANAS